MSTYRKWPEDVPCPDGWACWKDLPDTDKLKFENISKEKKMVYAYDPTDIRRNGKFRLGKIPAGWTAFAFDLSDPRSLLKERLKFINARFKKAVNENAVRVLSEIKNNMLKELSFLEENPGTGIRIEKCEIYGFYLKDGLYMTLNKWCEVVGIPYASVSKRMFVYGMPFRDAVRKMS